MKIAVDAMGGDHGPIEIVKGTAQAVLAHDINVVLVGDEEQIKHELDKYGPKVAARCEILHTDQYITMEDQPSQIVRGKRNSSIHLGLRLVKGGDADGFFSAGNTGAVMAVAMMTLRTLEGVDRPAIGAVLPGYNGNTVMLDVGANVDCKPFHFLQFAIMGSAYAKQVLGKSSPRVGLLSIGEEDVKGNEVTKTVFSLLKQSKAINFIGNVEGKELYKTTADVVVCDGFAGNIALKASESAAWFLTTLIKEELRRSPLSMLGAIMAKGAFKRIRKRADYSEYGGAPLLGVGGVCTIGHGSSNANAVFNALRVTKELVEHRINSQIEENIKESFRLLEVDKQDAFCENK